MSQSKTRLLELNARLAQNLTDKGVKATADETTTVLIDKVADIQSGGGFDVDAYFEQKFNAVLPVNGNYGTRFAHQYIDDVTFKPTCDMQPKSAVGMFQYCKITNLKQLLEDRGVVLDTSKCTNFNIWLGGSTITHLPCISFEGFAVNATVAQPFCDAYRLVYIEKIITRADLIWSNPFRGCLQLTTIDKIEGEIGTSWDISQSPLLDELTIDNIVNAYADMTGQTAPVLTLHPTVKAKIEADDAKEDTDPTKRFWLKTLTGKNVTLA